ncbi:unnamed protein product [Tilletia controversa]|nr:unnamed protein product [Tilletia controversa]CAD6945193.1 unnamed protein product [Tilletia controversa]
MPPMSVADHSRDSGSGMPGQKLCQCRSRCGTTGRWVDRQTYENHLLDFDDGCSSGSDDGGASGGMGELVDDFGQDPMDYINQEEDIELDIRPDAGLLPAEDDLLAGGFSLDIDDDGSDSGTGPDTSDPQPEWLRLFEIMLVWLNVEHSVPDPQRAAHCQALEWRASGSLLVSKDTESPMPCVPTDHA